MADGRPSGPRRRQGAAPGGGSWYVLCGVASPTVMAMRFEVMAAMGAALGAMGCSASSSHAVGSGQPAPAGAPSRTSDVSSERPWLESERPLVDAASLDVPMDDGAGEASLLPFPFAPLAIEARRVDATEVVVAGFRCVRVREQERGAGLARASTASLGRRLHDLDLRGSSRSRGGGPALS